MIILVILITYGLCGIVTHGKIFEKMRCKIAEKSYNVYEFVTCMQCTGFWCGLIVSLLLGFSWWSILLAFMTAGTNEIIDIVVSSFERK